MGIDIIINGKQEGRGGGSGSKRKSWISERGRSAKKSIPSISYGKKPYHLVVIVLVLFVLVLYIGCYKFVL